MNIDKRSGTVAKLTVTLMNSERLEFKDNDNVWYFEFKEGFLEICSNGCDNGNPYKPTFRTLIPLIQIRSVKVQDIFLDEDDSIPTHLEGTD